MAPGLEETCRRARFLSVDFELRSRATRSIGTPRSTRSMRFSRRLRKGDFVQKQKNLRKTFLFRRFYFFAQFIKCRSMNPTSGTSLANFSLRSILSSAGIDVLIPSTLNSSKARIAVAIPSSRVAR